MAAPQLVREEAQPGTALRGNGGPSGVWGTPEVQPPSHHSILPQLPCTYLAPHGSSLLPPSPRLLAQPVTAAANLQPLLLPSMLCAPCFSQGLQAPLSRAKATTSRESTSALKAWLAQHLRNPYPSKGEKVMLAIISRMSLTQVSTWFANARRRLKKEKKLCWAPCSKVDTNASKGEVEGDQPCQVQDEGLELPTKGLTGRPGSGCSPQESSQGPCLEPVPQRVSPLPPAAVLVQGKQPRIWCLAEIATAPREEMSHCLHGGAPHCWGCRTPALTGQAMYVLPPHLGLILPWGTESCQELPL